MSDEPTVQTTFDASEVLQAVIDDQERELRRLRSELELRERRAADLATEKRALVRLLKEVAEARHQEEHFGLLAPTKLLSECSERLCQRVADISEG